MKEIFISYSHQDNDWKKALQSQLEPLAYYNDFDVWDDRKIEVGQEWLPEIKTALEKAKIALLLISIDFLNSKFIKTIEIPALLQKRQNQGLLIIPIIIRECGWRRIDWLSALQVMPEDGKPIATLERKHDIEAEFSKIAEKINDLLNKIKQEEQEKNQREKERRESEQQQMLDKISYEAQVTKIQKKQQRDKLEKKAYEILLKIILSPIDRIFFIISVITTIAIIIIVILIFKFIYSPFQYSKSNTIAEIDNTMTLIKSGILNIGCLGKRDKCYNTEGVNDAAYNDRPIKIDSFYISKNEVTLEQFSAFAHATNYLTTAEQKDGCIIYKPDTKSWLPTKNLFWKKNDLIQSDSHPVVCISWQDTQAYLKWLNQIDPGKNYRLPTEAEWEYVARSNTETPYSTGNCITSDQANYNGSKIWQENDCTSEGIYRATTTEVRSFNANSWGLYDMHGNVWEWVQDCYHSNYNNIPQNGSAWETNCKITNDTEEISRVRRGGSWASPPDYLISARRSHDSENKAFQNTGFRVARSKPSED